MSKREKPKKEKKPTRSYQFRLYPTRKQEQKLEGWLVLCCETYNKRPLSSAPPRANGSSRSRWNSPRRISRKSACPLQRKKLASMSV